MPKEFINIEKLEEFVAKRKRIVYYSVQELLRAIAKEKCVEQINSGEFIAQYKLKTVNSISRALQKLLDNELVYKSEKGYVICDRFFFAVVGKTLIIN